MLKVEVKVDPKLQRLDFISKEAIYGGLMRVAEEVKDAVAIMPGPVVYPIQWVNKRQQRAVMAKLHATYLPYIRESHPLSEKLYNSWQISGNRGDLEVTVFTNVSYAPYVKTDEGIQPFHRETGHTTVKEDINSIDVGRIVDTTVQVYMP